MMMITFAKEEPPSSLNDAILSGMVVESRTTKTRDQMVVVVPFDRASRRSGGGVAGVVGMMMATKKRPILSAVCAFESWC